MCFSSVCVCGFHRGVIAMCFGMIDLCVRLPFSLSLFKTLGALQALCIVCTMYKRTHACFVCVACKLNGGGRKWTGFSWPIYKSRLFGIFGVEYNIFVQRMEEEEGQATYPIPFFFCMGTLIVQCMYMLEPYLLNYVCIYI